MKYSTRDRPAGLRAPAREGPVRVRVPSGPAGRFIFASPHAGRAYSDVFLDQALAPLSVLRRSEDAYVDALFADAPRFGAPLICATFPRVYVDPNRAPLELDPAMFDDDGLDWLPPPSPRASAGLGVIPRLAADGRPLYARRMEYGEAKARLAACYAPYHARLQTEIDSVRGRFGEAILIDCHSMPAASARGADIVLGDRYGASCSRALIASAESLFRDLGFAVVRNRPYAGGYTTEHYGRPDAGLHALQIEINRGLYLDEERILPSAGLPALRRALSDWIRRMVSDSAAARLVAE